MSNYTTYADMPEELKKRNSFHGASVTEIDNVLYYSVSAENDTKYYNVYSYATQILKINLAENTGVYNATWYSSTTKKIQSIIEHDILPYLKYIKYKNDLEKGVIL